MLRLLSAIDLEVDIAGAWHERQWIVDMIGFDFSRPLPANVNSHQRAASHSYQIVSIRRHYRRRVIPFHNQLRFGARRAQPKSLLIFIFPPAGADEIASRPHLPKTVFKVMLAFSHFFRHIFLSVENWAGAGLVRDLAELVVDD